MIKSKRTYQVFITLLFCFLQIAGITIKAQESVDRPAIDSLVADPIVADPMVADSLVIDSIAAMNRENMARLDSITAPGPTLLSADSIAPVPQQPRKVWLPNPNKATWLAVVFPGGGQIYNRKYWKLPIIYGGFAGCAYALNWNNNMFKDYSQAYVDIMDKNPLTNSYYDLLPPGVIIDEATDATWASRLKKSKDYYRRYRDISIFAFIGVYLLSIVDAYVDAELSNFDITPDLSMRVEPAVIDNRYQIGKKNNAIGLQCSFRF